jgi:hypothetical protein
MSETRRRNHNRGLRKVCGCSRRTWAKCPHSWHFNFKPKGEAAFRFSVDTEAGEHIAAKTKAEALADGWRTEKRRRRRSLWYSETSRKYAPVAQLDRAPAF